jgi:hypothetical protein
VTANDLTFLSEDIRRQREIAQAALEEAKNIDALLRETEQIDSAVKDRLERTKQTLLRVAKGLATNAASTSSAATITVLGAGVK